MRGIFLAISVILAVAVAGEVAAQYAPARRPGAAAGGGAVAREGGPVVRVREFSAVGRQTLVRTPEYRSTAGKGSGRLKEWAELAVRYDTNPEWIDELVFQFYVLVASEGPGKRSYSYYKNTLRFVDIERGNDHVCSVFIHPNIVKRYGMPVAAAVEITMGGKVMAVESQDDRSLKLPERWWQDPKIVQSDNVVSREGYLLDRADTPFALVNYDDYEVSR